MQLVADVVVGRVSCVVWGIFPLYIARGNCRVKEITLDEVCVRVLCLACASRPFVDKRFKGGWGVGVGASEKYVHGMCAICRGGEI